MSNLRDDLAIIRMKTYVEYRLMDLIGLKPNDQCGKLGLALEIAIEEGLEKENLKITRQKD